LQEAAAHAASAHGLREIDEETVDKVRALIIDK
jgi:predicted small metal-binding protein